MKSPVTVLIVDDHRLFREGLSALLSTDDRIRVVGQGGDGNEAVALARSLSPDVVLLDIEMPGPDVATTLGCLAKAVPRSRIVILTMHTQPGLVGRLVELGASGYLIKDLEIEELIAAVVSVGRDKHDFVTLRIPRHIVRQVADGPEGAGLSPRETEILTLVAQAKSNAQIGSALFITEGTVKRHLSNVFRKLDAVSRLDAVQKGIEQGHISRSARIR